MNTTGKPLIHFVTILHSRFTLHSRAYNSRGFFFLLSENEFLQDSWLPTTFLSGHNKPQNTSWLFYNQCCGGLPADICCLARFVPASFFPLSSADRFQSFGSSLSVGGVNDSQKIHAALVTLQPTQTIYNNLMSHLPSVAIIWQC